MRLLGSSSSSGPNGAGVFDWIIFVRVVRSRCRWLASITGSGGVTSRVKRGGIAIAHACESGEFWVNVLEDLMVSLMRVEITV